MPIIGISMSSTNEDTIEVNAPPTITPTARSITFHLEINCLNSFKMVEIPDLFFLSTTKTS